MGVFARHISNVVRDVAILMVTFMASVASIHAEKFSACGDNSIWSAYLVNKVTDEIIETYYPEEFFSGDGAVIPGFDENRNPYIVPNFVFDMQSCDIETFEIYFRYKYADPYVYDQEYKAVSTIWFTTKEEYELDFNEILKSKTQKNKVSISDVDSTPKNGPLRYSDTEYVLGFTYKDGVITKSGGGVAYYNICTLDQLGMSWDYLGGSLVSMYIKINDKVYQEDFSDCGNAMKYDECPPKEPDFIKLYCKQKADCRHDSYEFYAESNLGEIHWIGQDGRTYTGDDLTMMAEEYNGGCIAVWAQKDDCTPPVYDTICPPPPVFMVEDTEIADTVCWNDQFVINGVRVTKSGTYESVFTASNGCDSIVRYHVTVNSADTTISDTVFRCGINTITSSKYIKDTIEVAGGCPGLQMSPVGKISGRNHVAISTVTETSGDVSVDVQHNLGSVTYTTVWMGKDAEVSTDGGLTFDKAGMYKIIAYDEVTGCKDSMSFYYRTPIKPDLYLCPDNSDDYKWDIAGIDKYTNYRIFIYDRYGKELVHYENEFEGWDGTYNGRLLPSTDYWYAIEVDEGDYSLHGHFTLIRQPK